MSPREHVGAWSRSAGPTDPPPQPSRAANVAVAGTNLIFVVYLTFKGTMFLWDVYTYPGGDKLLPYLIGAMGLGFAVLLGALAHFAWMGKRWAHFVGMVLVALIVATAIGSQLYLAQTFDTNG